MSLTLSGMLREPRPFALLGGGVSHAPFQVQAPRRAAQRAERRAGARPGQGLAVGAAGTRTALSSPSSSAG